jgi:hypothetical protein
MQFGRFHGMVLLALGALLLVVQTVVVFKLKAAPADVVAPSRQPAAAEPGRRPLHGLEYLPGVIGVVLAGAGGYALAEASRKSGQQRTEEEKREEDRSFGPEGRHVSTPTIWKER